MDYIGKGLLPTGLPRPVNRPGVSWAILKTPLSLTKSVSDSFPPDLKILKKFKEGSPTPTCQLSRVMCQCYISHVFFFFLQSC